MALYQVTTTKHCRIDGVVIEPGMSVQVSVLGANNPVAYNRGELVQQAFLRIYGIDLRKLGILNVGYLRADRIG